MTTTMLHVIYHSVAWATLANTGWVTLHVRGNVAVMQYARGRK
jgi:hypothetical protein